MLHGEIYGSAPVIEDNWSFDEIIPRRYKKETSLSSNLGDKINIVNARQSKLSSWKPHLLGFSSHFSGLALVHV